MESMKNICRFVSLARILNEKDGRDHHYNLSSLKINYSLYMQISKDGAFEMAINTYIHTYVRACIYNASDQVYPT